MCFINILRLFLFISVVLCYRSNSPRMPHAKDRRRGSLARFNPDNTEYCECGHRKKSIAGKVVGGQEAQEFEFPWLVYLRYINARKQSIFCGSTLINNRILITAGHCVTDRPPANSTSKKKILRRPQYFTAVFHTFAPNNEPNHTNITINVVNIIVHPEYINKPDGVSDIALVVLEDGIDITDPVFNPVCIPQQWDTIDIFEGRTATVAGWGILTRPSKTPPKPAKQAITLQKLNVPLHSEETCLRYRPETPLTRLICADPIDDSGAGQGDSGGPLFIELPSKHSLQIGSVSQAYKKTLYSFGQVKPQVIWLTYYVRLTYFLPWIEHHSSKYDARWCGRASDPT